MTVVLGPILRKTDGYGYDYFDPDLGLSDGAIYRRIEDAVYAQRVESTRGGILCQTVDEFQGCLSRRRGMSA